MPRSTEEESVPHYDLKLLPDGKVIIPANFFHIKAITKLSRQWGLHAYSFWKYLDHRQRDEDGMPDPPQELIRPTEKNIDLYLSFVKRKLGALLGRRCKEAFEELCISTVQQDNMKLGGQDPVSMKDCLQIYFSQENCADVHTDPGRVFSQGYKWFYIHNNTHKLGWLDDTINAFFKNEGMLVCLADDRDEGARKRKHSIRSAMKKRATNTIFTEIKRLEKTNFKCTLQRDMEVTADIMEADVPVDGNDAHTYQLIELDAHLMLGASRRGGNRFYVQHLSGSPYLGDRGAFVQQMGAAVEYGLTVGITLPEMVVEITQILQCE